MPALHLPNDYYDLPPGKLVNLVTCLEMTKNPQVMPPQWPGDCRLQRFRPDDLAAFRSLFRAIGQDLLWFSRLTMPDEKLAAILGDPEIECFALVKNGLNIGLLELNFTAQTDCELAFFGLIPSEVGTGLGRLLMQEATARAWTRPISRCWVHTCHYDHPKALSFYQRAGFKPYKLMLEVHDDPRLSGHLPPKAAPHVPLLKP